jgi:hypothetical protein
MPKMKTHHWAGATLSMKNLFGIVPGGVYGWPKNVLHWAGIHQSIADLHSLFPKHFAIVDGIVGMDGNGPIQGRPKPAGVIVSGHDPVAVDATCCRIMQIEPSRIEYLTLAGGLEGIAEENIQQIGEKPDSVETRFELIMELRDCGGSGVTDPQCRCRGASGHGTHGCMRHGPSLLLLVPCFWQPRIQAGDLSSHLYNAWLAQLIERGQAPGLTLARQSNNVLFDLMLGG